jgi:hypothetical protein
MTADVTRLADESKSSIAAVCRALEVPRSSVYARRSRPISARAPRHRGARRRHRGGARAKPATLR